VSTGAATIALLPGAAKPNDRIGHHDYLGGCSLLAELLAQTPSVRAELWSGGWPPDQGVLEDARALVFYTGGRKQPFLGSSQRLELMQKLVDRGIGLTMIHQAVRYPRSFAATARSWLGGVHVVGEADRGHWRTRHRDFPEHPATRGVRAWRIRDGWLREIQFVEDARGVTPLVWSSSEHRGSPRGGWPDVVAWAYERPGGGRSFCYTGIDAHSAWSVAGVRQLLVNGILWSAGMRVPESGAPCALDRRSLERHLSPRDPRPNANRVLAALRGLFR
jgi:hypothetical protein